MGTEQDKPQHLEFVLITGMSGAGKTLALKTLEDIGYFCVDNLPVSLLDPLVILLGQNENFSRAALVMDARDSQFAEEAQGLPARLQKMGHRVDVLFLDADRPTLIRRFVETRRPHPMSRKGSVEEGVEAEERLLLPLKGLATHILNTSAFNVHELRAAIIAAVTREKPEQMSLLLTSFGFKYGIPLEAAFVFDVRYLPNPFFVDTLRDHPGTDPDVAAHVFSAPVSHKILHRIVDLVETVAPLALKDGRRSLMVAIGCTGGRHRSVALVEAVQRSLLQKGVSTIVDHRDLDRAPTTSSKK